MRQNLAPVVLFVYNRPEHTKRLLHSLQKNDLARQTILYIYADGMNPLKTPEELEKIAEVRRIIRETPGFRELIIREHSTHLGLDHNIGPGIQEVIEQHGRIIVLEDDLILSPGFLTYMNKALTLYESEEQVMHISGYRYPVGMKCPNTFFYNIPSVWGWGTWLRAWENQETNSAKLLEHLKHESLLHYFDLDGGQVFLKYLKAAISGKSVAWDINWYANICLRKGFCLYPGKSLVQNAGFDNSGTHCLYTKDYEVKELADNITPEQIPLEENTRFRRKMRLFYRYGGTGLKHRLIYHKNLMKAFLYKFIPLSLKNRYRKLKHSFF